MQVLALTLMEPPATVDAQGIRDEKVKLLRAVMIPDVDEAVINSVRGQYGPGVIDGEPVVGYREEEGVDPRSRTETFVAMRLAVDNWRWAGVPVYIRTGKRLPKRATEVVLQFQRVPHLAFGSQLTRDLRPNMLLLRIQPDEGICLLFGAKVPGEAFRLRSVDMDFSYARALPGHDRRGLRAAAARRDDRRRHPVHPHRRGRARLADRRPVPRGVEPGRRAPVAVPRRHLGPQGSPIRSWHASCASGTNRERSPGILDVGTDVPSGPDRSRGGKG